MKKSIFILLSCIALHSFAMDESNSSEGGAAGAANLTEWKKRLQVYVALAEYEKILKVFEAIDEGDPEKVQTLITQGKLNPNSRVHTESRGTDSFLDRACYRRNAAMVKMLLGLGVQRSKTRDTLVPVEAIGNVEMTQLLFDHGYVDINEVDDAERTLLFWTECSAEYFVEKENISRKDIDLYRQFLLNAGADVSIVPASPANLDCCSFLNCSVDLGFLERVLPHSDINVCDRNKSTPLNGAVQLSHERKAKWLLDRGASCAIPNQDKRLPIHYLDKVKSMGLAISLVKATHAQNPRLINRKDVIKKTPLELLWENDTVDKLQKMRLVLLLVRHGARVPNHIYITQDIRRKIEDYVLEQDAERLTHDIKELQLTDDEADSDSNSDNLITDDDDAAATTTTTTT